MVRRLIDITDNAALHPTLPPGLSFYYVRSLVTKHVGKDAAAMLSEPQAVPREGRRQWLIDAPVSARAERLGRLPPQDAATIRQTVAIVRQRVHDVYNSLWSRGDEASRQQANALIRAFDIPDDEECIWLVGDRTVIVGWGHVKANARELRPAELVVDLRQASENPNGSTSLTHPEPYQQAEPEKLHSQHSFLISTWSVIPALAVILWLAFVVLAGAAGWQLLQGCSLQVMGRTIYASSSGVCEIRAQNPLEDLLAANNLLVSALRTEQISLLTTPFCPVPLPQPSSPLAQGLTVGEMRAREQGGDLEGLAGVTLDWRSQDDLDLQIECPGGRMISPRKSDISKLGGCGDGDRDVDANDSRQPDANRTDTPVEHITWRKMPKGQYRVLIYPEKTLSSAPIPYHVTVRLKGRPPIQCEGTVRWDKSKGTGHAQYTINFNPYAKTPPQCRYENNQLHNCAPNQECGK